MDKTQQKTDKKNKDPTGLLVICVVAVLLVVFFSIIAYLMITDIRAPQVEQRCPVGLCKFDIFTGVKVCPEPGATVGLQLSKGTEHCTSADYCQQNKYQCAVLVDQTLNCNGVCDQPKCRCVANPATGGIVV